MKKALSLLLSAALLGSLCLPAAAAEAADARLTAVTAKVKATLGIDTEAYDQFYGEPVENELAPIWDLNWSGEDGSLTVSASDDGKVLSYVRYDDQPTGGSKGLSLPATSWSEAQATAQAFLERVLTAGVETASFREESTVDSLMNDRYYFYGGLLLNGLPSPLSFSISVRSGDGAVMSFTRGTLEGQYIGGIPSAKPAADAAKAAKDLAGTLGLRLEYVLDEDGKTAVLRYLPNPVDEYYVDGQTGKLVNLTELYRDLAGRDGGMSGGGAYTATAAENMNADAAKLTRAEQEGVEKLEGVLSKEDLDKRAQAIKELGLSKYTLASASYTVERADKYAAASTSAADTQVTARLTYARQDGEQIWRRNVTLDAKTGELISVYSSIPWGQDAKQTVKQAEAQKKAEAFLNAHYKEEFAQTAPYEAPARSSWVVADTESLRAWDFTFARQEHDIFFPANSLDVSIDASDGSVSAFSRAFDADVTFESPEGIVTETEAMAAYAALFDATLAYISVPQKLDLAAPDVRPLLEGLGMRYFSALKLGWALESNADGYVRGIDAKTGEPVVESDQTAQGVAYDDLEGHWVKTAAEALAVYGVGWAGGSLAPDAKLTQLDLVALLASTRDGAVDPAQLDAQAIDQLYQSAYYQGILTKADRDEAKIVTRLDIVRLLLDQAGYGSAAKLQGIYRCDFADQDTIPAEFYGYAALAQGLKLVNGDGGGNFAPSREATRAEAVGMLYNMMGQ